MPRGFLIFVGAFCLALLLLLGGLWATRQPRLIDTEIVIHAPVEQVWSVLGDGPAYPLWNPLLTRLAGTLAEGEKLEITAHPPGSPEFSFSARITTLKPNRELGWRGGLAVPGWFEGEHHFLLEALPGGATRLRHREHFSGILVGPLSAGLLDRTAQGFEQMNEALRQRCERPR